MAKATFKSERAAKMAYTKAETAKILLGVDDELASQIGDTAAECARELRGQGWEGEGSEYDLGNYPGDNEALEDVLGRKTNLDERILLERCIRAELGAS